MPLDEVGLPLRDAEHGEGAVVVLKGRVAPKGVTAQDNLVVRNVGGLALAGADLCVPLRLDIDERDACVVDACVEFGAAGAARGIGVEDPRPLVDGRSVSRGGDAGSVSGAA